MKVEAPALLSQSTEIIELEVDGVSFEIVDDPYSDRIRCDHPPKVDETRLAKALQEAADELGRRRVVSFADESLREGLEQEGFVVEGVMPGFYRGESDCVVVGWAEQKAQIKPADPDAAALTAQILADKKGTQAAPHSHVETRKATVDDAEDIAHILDQTFKAYPTPASDPAYIEEQLQEGMPFRLVREEGAVVACASADLIPAAQTAELTDCATRQSHRGQGLMQAILLDLMQDLRALNYPTAFTLARASVPGINIAFQRLGFKYRGRMNRSCRIGSGIEDMNIWSRWL